MAPMTEVESDHTEVRIGPMTDALLPAGVALEEACGLNSRGVEGYRKMAPNPKSILLLALASTNSTGDISAISPIGVFSGEVVVDELQIDNLAVSERWRRQGIGRALLKSALSMAASLGACTAALEVRAANASARSFYEKEGFTPVGLRKRYYADPPDDALLLSREI